MSVNNRITSVRSAARNVRKLEQTLKTAIADVANLSLNLLEVDDNCQLPQESGQQTLNLLSTVYAKAVEVRGDTLALHQSMVRVRDEANLTVGYGDDCGIPHSAQLRVA